MPTARRSSWNPLTEPRRWKPTAPQGCCCCGDVDRPILRASAVASDPRRLVGCARCSAVTESLGPRCIMITGHRCHSGRSARRSTCITTRPARSERRQRRCWEWRTKRVYRLVLGEVKYDVRGRVAAHLPTADSNPLPGAPRLTLTCGWTPTVPLAGRWPNPRRSPRRICAR